MIFQDPYASLNPRMKVADIIAEGIDIHGLASNKEERLKRVHDLLETVGLNKEHAGRYPHEFSGGQRQRVAIARALVTHPSILLADEPTGNLDSKTSVEIMQLFDELHNEGHTLIVVTHEDEIAAHCQRVVEMRDGKIATDTHHSTSAKVMA